MEEKIDHAIGKTPFPLIPKDLRVQLWADSQILDKTAGYLAQALDLTPTGFWQESLKVSRLLDLPDTQPLVDPAVWRVTQKSYASGHADGSAIWQAASLLFLDGSLYMLDFYEPDEAWLRQMGYTDDDLAAHRATVIECRALLESIADQTRDRSEPALRIAHCIRDLAYGDESRADDLKAMVESRDPEYRRIFVDCYWLPTEEERAREAEEERRRLSEEKNQPPAGARRPIRRTR
jgi:hypothetical protein